MSSKLREKLERAKYYDSNHQWNNAAPIYMEVLDLLYSDKKHEISLLPVSGLKEALEDLEGETVAIDEASEPLVELCNELEKAYQEPDIHKAGFVSVFQHLPSSRWTISYHGQRELCLGKLKITLPDAPSFSYVLKLGDVDSESRLLSKPTTTRMAYAWAHLAQSRVIPITKLYYESQILIDCGIPAIMQAAALYERALFLDPNYAWAWAHFGEVYRMIANGWPGSSGSLLMPDNRTNEYIRALVYFRTAIAIYNNTGKHRRAFWALAHYGAAITNTRGFIGSEVSSTALLALLDIWFGSTDSDDNYGKFLEEAIKALRKAQRLAGNYYPWAQYYYGGTLLIKAGLDKNASRARRMAMLSSLEITDAIFLQPRLILSVFEPGELYVNGFFQIGLVELRADKYLQAWKYTRLGMGRLFDFKFLPGLYALLGYQILVNIAERFIAKSEESTNVGSFEESELCQLFNVNPPIPSKPFNDCTALSEFIAQVFKIVYVPTVEPFIQPDIELSTNVTVSLVQALFILRDFIGTLTRIDRTHYRSLLEQYAKAIESKLRLQIDFDFDDRPKIHDAMFTFLNTDKPSYQISRSLVHKEG